VPEIDYWSKGFSSKDLDSFDDDEPVFSDAEEED
jgi:hypothetical protein